MILYAYQVVFALAFRLNLIAAHLVIMAILDCLVIIGYSIQFCAEHPIVDYLLTNHRINLTTLGITELISIDHHFPFAVCLIDIIAADIRHWNAGNVSDYLVFIFRRFPKVKCPRMILRIIDIAADVLCPAAIIRSVIAKCSDS